ncbi:hypothetical protein Tco_0236232 [Tanacetum coccineum]
MAEQIENQTPPPTSNKQIPPFYGFASPNGEAPMFPIMYPMLVPGLFPPQQGQELTDHGAGLYAVPTFPNSFMGPIAGYPSNALIPFTYHVPTRSLISYSNDLSYKCRELFEAVTIVFLGDFNYCLDDISYDEAWDFHFSNVKMYDNCSGPSPSEAGTGGEEQVQAGQQQQQQAGQQRQVVVRRFQIAIHLDLMLILKLAAVIFLFNQDGSKKRLVLLIFFASLIYLYQTGALAPLIRWLSQGMQRAATPPQQPRPAVRADNVPAAARQENENAPLGDGLGGAENENRAAGDANQPQNEQENGAINGNNRWWGIVKEIQLIVFGFITSLLPGFHNID